MQIKLKRLQAHMACHQVAVAAARQAGMTWTEIGERMGMPGEAARRAFARAQAAMRAGRLVPMEQVPLPDPPSPATVKPNPPAPPVVSPFGEQQEERPVRPGWTNIPLK